MPDPAMGNEKIVSFIRSLAEAGDSNPILDAGIRASVQTLNEGVFQETKKGSTDPLLYRKHKARLRSALNSIADAIPVDFELSLDNALNTGLDNAPETGRSKELHEYIIASYLKLRRISANNKVQDDRNDLIISATRKMLGKEGFRSIVRIARADNPDHPAWGSLELYMPAEDFLSHEEERS